ncbi:hypothetical protein LLG90_18805 [Aromatoleum toluclasticum]|uniref:hypothetical protein n=1 Tax=Aromatoleum toluclasticum TaxID=92003 RepID=UPI00036A6E85|nr:hypothetical protein [Aromatoleum toluclasticum]MCC4117409.1 hypothetical protein [Aromatoleum toluclasticum]
MKSKTLKLLAAMIAGGALIAATPAHADRDHWRDDGYREWRGDGHRHGHYKKFRDSERVVIRERIVERRPVVREYRYYERPIGYYAPAPVYAPVYAPRIYPRDPAITIGVDIPPLVIPLR